MKAGKRSRAAAKTAPDRAQCARLHRAFCTQSGWLIASRYHRGDPVARRPIRLLEAPSERNDPDAVQM